MAGQGHGNHTRTHGASCKQYRDRGTRMKNKLRKLGNHIKRFTAQAELTGKEFKDLSAIAAFKQVKGGSLHRKGFTGRDR